MTKTKFLLTTIAALLCSVMANAHDFEVNGIYYNILSDTTVEVTFRGSEYDVYDEYLGSVTIPSTVTYIANTYNVTRIGEHAFQQCSNITAVTIGNNVDIIDNYAFSECSGLTSVTIPNSVTCISVCAFLGCSSIIDITIPNSVTRICNSAFQNCKRLSSVYIPNSVKVIDYGPFSNCPSLTSIVVASDNDYYDSRNNCNAIIKTSTNELVQGCKNTIIPNDVLKIRNYAFLGCSDLKSINIPDGVTWIGTEGFADCDALTSIVIPNSITKIDYGTFYSCDGLKSIILPNNLTSIGENAFSRCSSLDTIIIPNSVTSIGERAFSRCSSLALVNIPEGIENIKDETFAYCSALTSITIPSSVVKIDFGAFEDCTSLNVITIPNSVISIEDEAFCWCSSLKTIRLSSNLESIGGSAFLRCSSLDTITIPNSVTSIGDYAFYGCEALTSVNIPEGIENIKDRTFADCSALTSITIPNSVKSIGNYAFTSCESLTAITFPNSVISVGEYAFWHSIDTIFVEATTPPNIGINAFNSQRICFVPCGTVDAYKASDWNTYCEAIIEPASEIQFNISVSDSTQGCIIIDQQPTCSNDTLIFHAEPIPSHYFVQWSDGNTDNPRTIILTQDTALAAVFAIKTCKLDILAEGNGIVTGAGTYNYGDTVTITATPDENHHFVQWSDGNTDTLRTIVLTQDTTLTASFAIDTYTLYLFTGENGIVTGAGTYNHGDTATITAIPNDGYYFTQWSDGNTDNLRTIIVTEDIFLSAYFIIGGQCGDSLYWTYKQSIQQLSILGTGEMYDYTVWTLPWQKYTHMIRNISLPDGMTTIGTSAFADCKYVQSIVIPSSVERIYDSAFENCRMLSELQFSKDGVLSELGSWTFYNCHELKEIAIPEGVTNIGYAAFYGCTYLNELTLPATMEYIADNGFAYCDKLQKMTVHAIAPPIVDARTFEDVDRTIPVYVPDESVNVYRSAPVWQEFNIQGKSGVPSNMDNVEASTCEVQKILRNGQLIIIRDGVEYNAMGMGL